MPPPKREGCARRFPPLYFSMGALLDFCRCFLSTREGQTSGAWELLQVFVFCNIPVLVARYRTSCEKMFPRLSFSVYRTARGRSELIPCITLTNHLTRFKTNFVGDMTVKYATIEAVNLCTCNASGFCAPVTHDASEVVMTFWHLSGIDRSDKLSRVRPI